MSVDDFLDYFSFNEELELVVIDLTHAHIWDQAAVAALDKVVIKFRRNGAEVQLLGLNQESATLVDKLAIHNLPDSLKKLSNH